MKYMVKNSFAMVLMMATLFSSNCTKEEKGATPEQISDNKISVPEQKPIEKNILKVMNVGARVGESQVVIPLYLSNTMDVAGVELNLNYDPEILTPKELRLTHRASGFSLYRGHVIQPGSYKIILVDFMGKILEPGDGKILTVNFSVADGADPGTVRITLAELNVSDRQGNSINGIKAEGGELKIE